MTDTPAMKAVTEISFLWDEWENHKGYKPLVKDMAAIIEKHQQPSVPIAELRELQETGPFKLWIEISRLIRQAEQEKPWRNGHVMTDKDLDEMGKLGSPLEQEKQP